MPKRDSEGALGDPQLPARIFLNYSRQDREVADWLRGRLIDAGAEVWKDTFDIRGGDKWKTGIDKAISSRQFMIAVLTRNSTRPKKESEENWILYEQDRAALYLKHIIPCLFEEEKPFLDDDLLPPLLKPINYINFLPDREAAFLELVNVLRGSLRRQGGRLPNQWKGTARAFVGRQQDLTRLKRLIDETEDAPRPIAIWGMGGIGKTMLASELCIRLASHFPGGILRVRRGKDHEPASVVIRRWARMASQSAADDADVDVLLEQRYGALLALVDDVPEEDIIETKKLLEELPGDTVTILTTRQQTVGDALGALLYEVQPLPESDALALLHRRLRDRFGRLPTLEQDIKSHRSELIELTRSLNGHPLAIDLGIGTCEEPSDIPELVKDLKASLATGVESFELDIAMGVADRNSSLALSLRRSLDDLSEDDAEAKTDWTRRFRALGMLPDGARSPRELLYAIWGDGGATRTAGKRAIRGLVNRSMLSRDHGPDGMYFNHPVLRAYAAELLNQHPEQFEHVWNRYHEWVVEQAQIAYSQPPEEWTKHIPLVDHVRQVGRRLVQLIEGTIGPLEAMAGAEQLSAGSLDTLRKLEPQLAALGLRYSESLKEVVYRRIEWGRAGQRALRLGICCARATGERTSEIDFMMRLGHVLAQTEPDDARRYLDHAIELARQVQDRSHVAGILTSFGELERLQAQWDSALKLLGEALSIHRQLKNRKSEADTLKSIGEVYWRMSEFDEALSRYRLALEIFQHEADIAGEADILNKMASVKFNQGLHRDALTVFERALELHRKVGDRAMEAEDHNDMGACHRYLKKLEEARKHLDEALRIDQEYRLRRHESIVRCNLAATLIDLGQYELAATEAQAARKIAIDVRDPVPRFWSHCWESRAMERLGDRSKAERGYRQALDLCRGMNNPRGLAGVLFMLTQLLKADPGRTDDAAAFCDEALEIMESKNLSQAFGGYRIDQIRQESERLAAPSRNREPHPR